MRQNILRALLTALVLMIATKATAGPCTVTPNNCDPPAGNVILDLHGQPVPHSYAFFTTNFVASLAVTNLSFAFREDPAFLFLDDVTLQLNGAGANLLTNGGFESGVVGNSAPVGWTYLNQFGAAAGGQVTNGGCRTGSNCYTDGAVQAYDAISQAVNTTIGQSYTLGFWLSDNGFLTQFRRLSDNGNTTGTGGNGIDLLVYAGALPTNPATVPEPASLGLVGLGLVAAATAYRRRQTKQ